MDTTRATLPERISEAPEVVRAYFARGATVDLLVFVVLTTEFITLPPSLEDGTLILQINVCEAAKIVPATPSDTCSSIKVRSGSLMSTISSLQEQVKTRKNVLAVTAALVREQLSILVGVVGKGFVPRGDTLLPKRYHGYPIIVCEYREVPLHKQRWQTGSPQPQTGGAIAPATHANRMGTAGPAVSTGDGKLRFFTSGHLFKDCAVGERVVLPGMVARALQAIDSGGGGRNPLTAFYRLLREDKTLSEAVQHVMNTYPGQVLSEEDDPLKEFATIVFTDEQLDVALVEVDQDSSFSLQAWHWTDAGPPDDFHVVLDEYAWKKEEFLLELGEHFDGIKVNGYGAARGEMVGYAHHLAHHILTDNDVILMRGSECNFGDSGAAVWTTSSDGTVRVLGMVGWRAEWALGADNISVTEVYIVPAWSLSKVVSDYFNF